MLTGQNPNQLVLDKPLIAKNTVSGRLPYFLLSQLLNMVPIEPLRKNILLVELVNSPLASRSQNPG